MIFLEQTVGELPTSSDTIKVRPVVLPDLAPGGKALLERLLYTAGRTFVAAFMRLTLDMDVLRHAPLPEGPKILAANHPTTTDPFYLLTLLPEPVSVLVTEDAFDVPCFGPYLRATNHVPAVGGSGGATVKAVVRQIESGRSVAIFPEGALSPLDGSFHQPHSGVARVALRTGAPVISVGIGLHREHIHVMEIDTAGRKTTGHLYFSGPYAMTMGRPLYFRGDVWDRERVRGVAAQIMSQIRDLAYESQMRVRSAQVSQAGFSPARTYVNVRRDMG
jgi:1-acyl-sn-glycerol-3-phosphate acyltransferase